MGDLTIVCGYWGKEWKSRAERAVESVLAHAPDVETIVRACPKGGARFELLRQVKTLWALFLDADVLATGDVREVVSHVAESGCFFGARLSNLHDHPAWHRDAYEKMCSRAGLSARQIPWNGAFVVTRTLGQKLGGRIAHWRRWYLKHGRGVFGGPNRKPDQHGLALALSEAGISSKLTCWLGGEHVSWHSRGGELGIIHHFNGQVYARLEAKGGLGAAIQERRK